MVTHLSGAFFSEIMRMRNMGKGVVEFPFGKFCRASFITCEYKMEG